MSDGNNVLITGIPRSGTTLVCSILGEEIDVVAAHEPIDPSIFENEDLTLPAVAKIQTELASFRRTIDREGLIVSKQVGGRIPSNSVSIQGEDMLRGEVTKLGLVEVTQQLSDDFVFVVKHNALFTSLLPALSERFPVFAIVRNPMAVLHSWLSVDFPVNRGRLPMGERFDPELHEKLNLDSDVLSRQLTILMWFFEKFRLNLDRERIIRYEDVISTQGRVLSPILGRSIDSRTLLREQSHRSNLGRERSAIIRDALLAKPEIYDGFFSTSDINNLFESEFV
ncbi:MAG: hypothetical protein JJ934_16670 [Pseudomonadales bacterium]|nr:hypothetical protein [Pseudomonadales bacterium]